MKPISKYKTILFRNRSFNCKGKGKLALIAFLFFALGGATTLFGLQSKFGIFDKTPSGQVSGDISCSNSSAFSLDDCSIDSISPTTVDDPFPSPKQKLEGIESNGISIYSITNDGYFYSKNPGESWNVLFLKGVNMGLTLPTTDLANPDISYDTYYRWFEAIHSMNANTIKIFTIMNPDFYSAFYDFNQKNKDRPLYLLQGIWIDENDMYDIGDAYAKNNKILNDFKKTAKEMVDIIHGKSNSTAYGLINPAIYDKDISPYIAGFILGLEWMPEFIQQTNDKNPTKKSYMGKYLYTQNASAFEAFLCNVGNTLIEYQTSRYQTQVPVAFLNWSTTDTLIHTNEPFPEEDAVSLDTNHILSTNEYLPGMFAAIDIYPYYPEFMNYQKEYISFVDPFGRKNPYRAYLRDLKKEYTIPLVVAEFGVPTSRGIAHKSTMGFDQGGITEEQQGEMDLSMMKDIAKEGYAGGMIFSWQDEWFKQTWNTIKYYATDTDKRTSNVQSTEQHYGILAFETGVDTIGQASYPDGSLQEWDGISNQAEQAPFTWKVSIREDALSLMCKWDKAQFNPEKDTLAIAIGTTKRGSSQAKNEKLIFTKPADFILLFNAKDNTRLLVDSYYDSFYYQYMVIKELFPLVKATGTQNSGIFNPIRQFTSNEIFLPVEQRTINPMFYDSGVLKYGQANPNLPLYDSLADFYYTDDFVEIKIPWTLLGVSNFVEKKRIADFYKKKIITTELMDSLVIGVGKQQNDETTLQMQSIELATFDKTNYTERLKKSYSILSKGLFEIDIK